MRRILRIPRKEAVRTIARTIASTQSGGIGTMLTDMVAVEEEAEDTTAAEDSSLRREAEDPTGRNN